MWRRRTTFVRRVLLGVDTLISALAFVAALFLRSGLANAARDPQNAPAWLQSVLGWIGERPLPLTPEDYQLLLVALLPLWALALQYSKAYDFRIAHRRIAWRYLQAVAIGVGMLILLAFLFKLTFVSRSFVILFAGVQLIALIAGRVTLLEVVRMVRRRRGDAHRVVVVGTGDRAVEFAQQLTDASPIRLEIQGFVGVMGESSSPQARPRLGYVGSLDALLDRMPVDEVVFAVPGKSPDVFRDALSACDDRGVDVLLTLPPKVPASGKMELANVSGVAQPMIGLRRTPTAEAQLALKRVLDILGGIVGLALAGPVMAVTALAIKLDSKGPVLFKQIRAGRNGRKFTMYKFRSMVVDAEAKKAALMHLNEMGGPVFKIKRDPRITAVGRFIRKTSIDELPQFFNIIMGDMSMVGPRPPLPSEVDDYEAWQRRRLSVKPGLTGLWQVSGRNQVDFDEWMQLDLNYIDNWSIWLDIKILLKTVPTVLFHKGAS
jgi:exopolysaccharide biosynthesis polyprenyl glycosylphosphotransferase